VSLEMSPELIPANTISIEVGVAVSLPPVYCSSKQLVHCEKDLLMVGALSYLHILLNLLQPVLCIHGILGLREGARVGPQKFSQPRRWWGGGLPAAAPAGEVVDAEESAVLSASAGSGWQ
jgi:hypothetical protein